jgi:hypothetical protein
LLSEDVITSTGSDGDTSNGGNGWGPNKVRSARTADGTLFAVYTTGPAGSSDKGYTLVKSTNGGSSWTTVDSGNDGGRETPLLLADPASNTVYVIIQPYTCPSGVTFCSSPGSRYGYPVLVNEGVDGAGPRTTKAIPGSWLYGTDHPYSSAAVDASGNVYFEENLAQNQVTDAGIASELAWTTGGTGNLAWHFTSLPCAATCGSANDVRYTYTIEMPDNKGGIDVAGVTDTSCENAAWAAANGYTIPSADQTGSCYIVDRVEDWHTSNLNAAGGPSWTTTQVAVNDCTSCTLSNGINEFAELDDAYRDTSGNVHLLTSLTSGSNPDVHTILSNGTITHTASLPHGYCDAPHMKITQDYSGRFWLFSNCNGNTIYSWYATDSNGLTLSALQPITTTHTLDGYGVEYLATSRSGDTQNQTYLDMVVPYNNFTGLLHFRLKLSQ